MAGSKSFYFSDGSGDTFKVKAPDLEVAKKRLHTYLDVNGLSYPGDTMEDIIQTDAPDGEVCLIVTAF